jgi:hypothetical protein
MQESSLGTEMVPISGQLHSSIQFSNCKCKVGRVLPLYRREEREVTSENTTVVAFPASKLGPWLFRRPLAKSAENLSTDWDSAPGNKTVTSSIRGQVEPVDPLGLASDRQAAAGPCAFALWAGSPCQEPLITASWAGEAGFWPSRGARR